MYSGQLVHMMALYEALSYDMTYSDQGFSFASDIHWTLDDLLTHMANVQLDQRNRQGGISCEPFQVFTICNQHQNIAFTFKVAVANNQTSTPQQLFSLLNSQKKKKKKNDNANTWNRQLKSATKKFRDYFVDETSFENETIGLGGWVRGLYFQDKRIYLDEDSGLQDQPWSKQHLKAGWLLDFSGFASVGPWGAPNSYKKGSPFRTNKNNNNNNKHKKKKKKNYNGLLQIDSPARDNWAAAFAYVWLNESDVKEFVCENGLSKLYNNRFWSLDEQYNGTYFQTPHTGVCFATAMYTVAAMQCLPFMTDVGISDSDVEQRVEMSRNFLINKFGVKVPMNKYNNLSVPLIDSSGVVQHTFSDCDKTTGSSLLNTALLALGMVVGEHHNGFRNLHSQYWPTEQIEMQVLQVKDYPFVFVRSAQVIQTHFLEFELVIPINAGYTQWNTQVLVQLDGSNNLVKLLENGMPMNESSFFVVHNILTVDCSLSTMYSNVYQVFTQ
ncbi:hypothetical protein RFI_01563 [Reticulomyxa filosa]|uniref:Linalool dehydratase/isomerase domain-containing protein n=1 Tax=Reticulomyxa filosa TaxID=46433 RepID=X6PBK4_RETFI|nr:hypothetical protein RFI_01563 [Reticulomyxa filosa]|eukprot:ETO35498.1 hypothetical protein RFI_01563 [Reticulomyxa filosa]